MLPMLPGMLPRLLATVFMLPSAGMFCGGGTGRRTGVKAVSGIGRTAAAAVGPPPKPPPPPSPSPDGKAGSVSSWSCCECSCLPCPPAPAQAKSDVGDHRGKTSRRGYPRGSPRRGPRRCGRPGRQRSPSSRGLRSYREKAARRETEGTPVTVTRRTRSFA
eukprot:1428957-Rhodomonas_salina.1